MLLAFVHELMIAYSSIKVLSKNKIAGDLFFLYMTRIPDDLWLFVVRCLDEYVKKAFKRRGDDQLLISYNAPN